MPNEFRTFEVRIAERAMDHLIYLPSVRQQHR